MRNKAPQNLILEPCFVLKKKIRTNEMEEIMGSGKAHTGNC